MKSIFVLFLFAVFQATTICTAQTQGVPDTMQYSSDVTLAQAMAAEDYVVRHHIHTVVLWCACCKDELPEISSLEKLSHRKSRTSPGYEMVMVSKDNGVDEMFININHIWVHEGKDAVNLGHKLRPEIDTCSAPIPWTFGR